LNSAVDLDPEPVGIDQGNTPPANPDFSPVEAAFARAGLAFRHRRSPIQAPYSDQLSTDDPIVYLGPIY
jgi:hypothetical protein